MKLIYFISGALLSAVICGAIMIHQLHQVQAQVATEEVNFDVCQLQAKSLQRTIYTQNVTIQSMRPGKQGQIFTVLYDSSAASKSSVPADVVNTLNLVRPGLGTILGRFTQTGDSGPAWFIPANVKPIFYGDVSHAAVVTVENNQVIAAGNPLSLQQVQANPSLLAVQQ